MPTPPDIVKCYKYIDTQQKKYVEELRKIVGIPTISSNFRTHKQISDMIHWLESRLKELGFTVALKDLGNYLPYGQTEEIKIPFLLLGTLGNDSSKKTLLYYCHLDVLKVEQGKWQTNPFELTEKNGKLYGRGTAKMKGPLLCVLNAIKCYKELGLNLPINIQIFCESMNECNSEGIPEILKTLKTSFLKNIDCILMNESNWLGRDYPCIVYGFRGVCFFDVTIEGPSQDFNSGDFGGIIFEPIQDLIFLLNHLVDLKGRILVPNFYDGVNPVTLEEENVYHNLKINLEDYKKNAGLMSLSHEGKVMRTLMHVWRHPSFNLHFIDTTNKCDDAIKLAIPRKVSARFSVSIVPHQDHERVYTLISEHLRTLFRARCTPNNISVNVHNSFNPWYENYLHWNYRAAKIAIRQVFKEEANLTREGKGFPILLKLRKATPKKNILVLPLVNNEANIHSEDENISMKNYIEGTKLLANYFYQLGNISK